MRPTLLLMLSSLVACGEYDLAVEDRFYDVDTGTGQNGDGGAPSENDGLGDEDPGLPPEAPDAFSNLRPAQTDLHVFIANPERGTVTRVNVLTHEVRTTDVGRDPRVVLTSSDFSRAVSFNRGDDSVTVIDAATLQTATIAVRDNFNSMVMSPDGDWVTVFHDIAAERPDDPPASGLQSYNEISLVNVVTGEHFPMAVGFNPREVVFTPDSTQVVVVSDEFLALIDLTQAVPSPLLVQVADDLLDPPLAEEIAISPAGDYAFVRQFGAEDLLVVDLFTRTVNKLPVGLNPTDLDLTPDGQRVVVISRDSSQVHVFSVQDPFEAPDIIDLPAGTVFGSIAMAPSGNKAVLYSTASLEPRFATWDLTNDQVTVRSLVKPVAGAAVTPTGESLLILHTKEDAPDAVAGNPFEDAWALTLLDLDDFRSNPIRLPAEPIGWANAESGRRGYLILEDHPSLAVLSYDTLLADEYTLRSTPVFLGVLPDLDPTDGDEAPAWISQEHSLGRISFFDPDNRTVETITGFELNSQIEE